ncbi:hypothetical protein BMT66_24670, partial [Escherichia coli]
GTVCVVGKIRDLILQLSKSSIYSTKPLRSTNYKPIARESFSLKKPLITVHKFAAALISQYSL